MPPSASNSSSSAPRRRSSRPTSARRASAAATVGPRTSASPASSSPFDDFHSYAPTAGYFFSTTPLQIKRTVNITVEISSGTATANHMDVSQYHMPVTTSCYSPSSGDVLYEYSTNTSEYETATEYGAYPLSSSSTATSSSYSYEPSAQRSSTDESEFPCEPPPSYSKYKPQHESKTPPPAAPKQAYQTSTVDSREDALVVEARVAISERRVNDLRSNLMYGWESIIDDLLQ
ncbi:uncharacterized protein H6S33_003455 [Morchella sextelata]|uniref:uncharacterized protein n=1 Tax=Morchella sextelata TaxID=1174677 RepID=UPI001D059545|nr:uncharacterized protein H6S33_003455 [Morchella sextelata]KAH0606621.1 hypothetical protein H6S33_003455 [Morchella sextelata]